MTEDISLYVTVICEVLSRASEEYNKSSLIVTQTRDIIIGKPNIMQILNKD
jgi:hypothetical protein